MSRNSSPKIGQTFVALFVLGSAACGGGEPPVQSPVEAQVTGLSNDDQSRCEYKARPDREVRETAGPGSIVPNIRRVYAILGTGEDRRRVLLCREVDSNLDGVKDVVRTYNDKGDKLNELSDSDYDGKIDTWVTFSGGRIAKVEVDKYGTGKPSEWRFYVGGKLSRVQRDTNKDGKADVWEVYGKGKLQRMGVDLDGDGRVDRWDRDELSARAEEQAEEEEATKKDQQKGDQQKGDQQKGDQQKGDQQSEGEAGPSEGDQAAAQPGTTG